MAQSLVKNYVHIIFSTKHRLPLIKPEFQPELYSYLAGTCRDLDCHAAKIGGHLDHIHIACLLSKK
jgi:putative transposase